MKNEDFEFEESQDGSSFEDVLTDLHNTFSSMDNLLYDLTIMVSEDPEDEKAKEALEYVKKMMKDYYKYFDWKGLGWVTLNDPCVKGIVD